MRRNPELHQLVKLIAQEHGLRVAYDTRYGAFNWEIRWWADDVLNAVDVQPYPDGWVELSRLRTRYPLLPRLLAWAQNVVPMFPRWCRTTHAPLARFAWPSESMHLREAIVSQFASDE